MMLFTWRAWRNRLSQLIKGRRRGRGNVARRRPLPLTLEALEARTVPAAGITVLATGIGTGSLDAVLLAHNGTITVNDGGGGGTQAETLSRGALLALGATTNISITARQTITFNDLTPAGGTLSLQTGVGHGAAFSTAVAGGGAIRFANTGDILSTAGGTIVFTAGTDLTVAGLSSGGGDVSLTAGASEAGNLSAGSILTGVLGNITLQATNAAGGTVTQSGTATGLAISVAATGTVTVDALRGTTVGLISNTGSVNSLGSRAVQASSQLSVAAATGITLNTLAASVQAGNSVSANVSITQVASPAQTLTVAGSGVADSAAGGTITLDNLGGSITVAGNGVQSNNGNVTLAATDLQITSAVNSGTARAILESSTPGGKIDVGTNSPGKLGLTQAELNDVTAGLLQIGSLTSGNIDVSAPVSAPAGWNTLALLGGDTVTEEAAGALTVPNFRVSSTNSATLLSANNVGVLAGTTGGNPAPFSFNDGTHLLTVGTVDGTTGLATSGSDIHLIADDMNLAQQVSAGNGVVILEQFSAARGIDLGTNRAGNLGLTNAELNEVTAGVLRVLNSGTLNGAILVTAAISPAHIGALSLESPNATGSGIIGQFTGATITVAGGAGGLAIRANSATALIQQNDVSTLAAAITGTGNSFQFTNAAGFTVGTVGGVTGITASTGNGTFDILTAGGSVTQTSGASIVSENLALFGTGPFALTEPTNHVGTLAANVTNAVSYTDSGGVSVGTVNGTRGITTSGGDVTVTGGGLAGGVVVNQPIDTTTTANITLSGDSLFLLAPVNAHAGTITLEPTTSGRAIDLGTNPSLGKLGLEQGDLNRVTAGVLRIGNLSTSGSITVTAPISDAGLGWSTLSLLTGPGAGISQNSGATLTASHLNAVGDTGVTLNQNNIVGTLAGATRGGPFSFTDSTNLTVDNVDSGLGSGLGSGIVTQGQTVSLTVNAANDGLTVSQPLDTTHTFATPAPGGANVTLTADSVTFGAGINAGTAGAVTLEPFSSLPISLGGTIGTSSLVVTDADLGAITAAVVRLGSAAQAQPIALAGTIHSHAGYNTLDLIATGSGGAIAENGGSIQVANLALQADAGIGGAGAVAVVGPVNLAFHNAASGNVQVSSTAALTVASVDGLSTSANAGGGTTLTAGGPLTFAVNTTSGGTLTATTTEGDEVGPNDDNITVNANVTVESTGGDVDLTAADSVITGSGSLVKSDGGTVSLKIGVGDADHDAVLALSCSLSGNFSYRTSGNLFLDTLFPNGLNDAGHTVALTSTGGGIFDSANPADTGDETDVTAASLTLSAAAGIGTPADPVVTQVGTLAFSNSTSGDVDVTNASGNVSAGGTNSAPGAPIDLTALGGGTLTVNAGNMASTDGGITLGADSLTLTGTVSAGTGPVTLEQAGTTPRLIDVGLGTTSSALDLSSAALARVTAGVLRIGRTDNAGNLTVTAALSSPGGAGTLDLRSGGSVSQTSGSTITVANLAAQGAGGVSLGQANQVSALAGTASNHTFTFTDAGGTLTVGTVDGVTDINAGTGDVNLTVGTAGTTGILIDPTNNGGNAVVTGHTVSLTALGPSNGATGQIGSFSGGPNFFEVAAATINASTDNSRAWIALLGGAAVGSVNVGTDTAVLETVNGDLTSTHTGSTPDVIAGTVNLSSPGTGGSFGSAACPLLVQTSSLRAGVTGTGSINVTNVAAGGNLNVASATTGNGAVNLVVAGGNLTTTAATGTDISAPGNTVTLTASGNVISGTGVGVTDVGAANLAVTGTGTTSGLGTSTNPLKTALAGSPAGVFAARVGTGGVFLANTSAALTVGTVGTVSGVTATGGTISIATSGALTVAQPVQTAASGPGAGTVTVSGNGAITIQAALTGSSASVLGGAGNDTITVVPVAGTTPLTVNGGGGTNSLTVNDAAATAAETYTVTGTTVARSGAATITYGNVAGLAVDGGKGNNTFNVQGTSSGTPVVVSTGNGDDTVNVGSAGNTLAALQGALTVTGGTGTDTLNVNDQGTTAGQTYTITSTGVTGTDAPGAISYSGVRNLAVSGGSGGNVFNVQSTGAGTSVVVNTGNGHNTANVGSAANTLTALLGTLTVNGQGGTNALNANDQGTTGGQSYTVTGGSIARPGVATIHYSNVAAVTVSGGSGSNTFDVTPAAATTFTLHGTSSASPANTLLRVHLSGAAPKGILLTHPGTGYQGQLTFSNRQPIVFDRMGNFTFVM